MQCVTAGGRLEPLAVLFRYPSTVVYSILRAVLNVTIWVLARLG